MAILTTIKIYNDRNGSFTIELTDEQMYQLWAAIVTGQNEGWGDQDPMVNLLVEQLETFFPKELNNA